MDCQTVQELISSFVDGELDEHSSVTMFTHLGSCKDCQSFLRTLMDIRDAFASGQSREVPGSIEASINESLSGKRPIGGPMPAFRIIVPVPVALAAAVLLVIGSLTFMPLIVEHSTASPASTTSVEPLPFPPESMQRIMSILR